jgi:murein L,D-transpeptidase YafK
MTRRLRLLGAALAVLATGPATAQVAADEAAADFVLVEKAARRITLYDAAGAVIRVYTGIQLGDEPVGPKHFRGDERTPEGRYFIDYGNPASAYHLSLHISYPQPRDVAYARAAGLQPGGQIFIHGQPNGMAERPAGDWTDGCIAVSDYEIEEIWNLVGDGTPVQIRP